MKGYPTLVVFIFLCCLSVGHSADISNYSACDVCHGSIHFRGEEAKQILGREGVLSITALPVGKMIKLDLDGVKKTGTRQNSDEGYEIKAWNAGENLFIQWIKDHSSVQIVLAATGRASIDPMEQFSLEIFLNSGRPDEIDLKDSMEAAWQKLSGSQLYKWVSDDVSGLDEDQWLTQLKEKVIWVSEMLAKAE
ncbi:MAG: hypothetical protein D3926_06810 [Desulfobacteraceae bacterium]|nr:MAG: hypothetical protein D3926_06810 [Desulfobacteraceae bacterium]